MRAAERTDEAAMLVHKANIKWDDTDYHCSGLELLIELLHMRDAVIQLHTLKASFVRARVVWLDRPVIRSRSRLFTSGT